MDAPPDTAKSTSPGRGRWLARFGVLGVMFFLIKGLAWLIVPAVLVAMSR